MTESPTLPLRAVAPIRLSPEAMRRLRRQTRADHARQRDLDAVVNDAVRDRPTAMVIAARISARGLEQTTDEAWAVLVLMKRWGITAANIVATQRRTGST